MILAIESSCDETAVALVKKRGEGVMVIAEIVASSVEIQEKYGGVVPEVAAREQVRSIIPVIEEVIQKAGVKIEEIEKIAVTAGPGLVGSLLIGVETGKSLAWVWGKKIVAVNHMKGHVMANWIGEMVPRLPAVGLVVSGGHSDLYLIKELDKWKWLGGTRDDAAGECFDKCARLLDLPYPGGPSIEKAAEKANKGEFRLPRPMLNQDNLEMSFSGIKTALANEVSKGKLDKKEIDSLAKEVNEAISEILVTKTEKAVRETNPKSILMAGGVTANKELRERMKDLSNKVKIPVFMPEFKYCTDNAVMIGAAAVLSAINDKDIWEVEADPNLEIEVGV